MLSIPPNEGRSERSSQRGSFFAPAAKTLEVMGFPDRTDTPENQSALASTVQQVKRMKKDLKIVASSDSKSGGHGPQPKSTFPSATHRALEDDEISPLALPSPLSPLHEANPSAINAG
jgi:hypothetical protein